MRNDMGLTAEEYRVVLRQYFFAFIQRSFRHLNPSTKFLPNWHIEVIAATLEKCMRGEIKRLIINVPPRSLKSHCASIAFPAFVLGHNPAAKIVCVSYSQQLAENLADACRSVMLADWYRDLFPTRLASNRQAIHDFQTTAHGGRLSTSVGGGLMGRGGDLLIGDDLLKPDEAVSDAQRKRVNDWYDNTLASRLNDRRNGRVVLIMQRLHEDDVVGHVQTLDDWHVLKFPAIAEQNESYVIETPYGRRSFERKVGDLLHPEREPREVLELFRRTQGEYNFACQCQQAPAPLEGGIIKASWFKRYLPAELTDPFEMKFQSWDTANKATELCDYSVCTTWGVKSKKLYLLDLRRGRMEYPDLKRAIRDEAAKHRPRNVLIEDKASGTQLIQELIREGVHGVTRYAPKMDKVMRLRSVSSTIENGLVFLPETADWLAEYLHELTIFPNGRYDDQADSTSQALDWIKDGSFEMPEWLRIQARRFMIEEGRFDDVREMDAKYGAPEGEPEASQPPLPSGPAVYRGEGPEQERKRPLPSGPAVYRG